MNHGQRWKPAASVIGHDASVDKQKTADVNLAPWQKCTARACCDSVIILIKRHYSLVPWVDRVMRILERTALCSITWWRFYFFRKDELNIDYTWADNRSRLKIFRRERLKSLLLFLLLLSNRRIELFRERGESKGKHRIGNISVDQ